MDKSLIYEIEKKYFSKYAMFSENTRGRLHEIEPCPIRTEYQRDRDRIIHCKAFRRLKHKTQVFLAPEGDHYRTRLTHTLEVSQIARTIARALRLNEDLTEAISMGHDLGHTPFGHAGERVLYEMTNGYFEHNKQSLRVVDFLESNDDDKTYGLNLTFEVRDGILNHRSNDNPITLEGKVVSYADRIAYVNHDIEDAIRGKVLTENDLPSECVRVLGSKKGERIDTLVKDLINNSDNRNSVEFSSQISVQFDNLRKFLFDNLYTKSKAKKEEQKAEKIVEYCYKYFYEEPRHLPPKYKNIADKDGLMTAVCDYLAGMSDRYLVSLYESLVLPNFWNKY